MTLVDFGRMESGKVRISPRIGAPLGLVDGSEVFSSMFKYEIDGKGTYEIVLSPFGPENYRGIAYITIHVRDEPGALAQAAQFLKARNIDILNSETVSSIPNVVMVWEMLVDLSFFGDSATLGKEFEDAKSSKDPSLSMVDLLCIEDSDLATRYTRGAAPGNPKIKTKALRKTEKKASIITGGVFELPHAYLNFLGKDSGHVMFVAEPEAWILSVVFLNDDSDLSRARIELPDRPGAVHEVMRTLGEMSVNVLSGYTNVLVYYERMTCELVIDTRSSSPRDEEEFRAALKNRISALGPQFSLTELTPVPL